MKLKLKTIVDLLVKIKEDEFYFKNYAWQSSDCEKIFNPQFENDLQWTNIPNQKI